MANLTPAEALRHAEFAVASYCKLTGHDEAVIVAVLRASVEDAELLDWLTEALKTSNIQLQTDYDTFRPGFSLHSATMDSTWGHPDLRAALRAARTPAPGERT